MEVGAWIESTDIQLSVPEVPATVPPQLNLTG